MNSKKLYNFFINESENNKFLYNNIFAYLNECFEVILKKIFLLLLISIILIILLNLISLFFFPKIGMNIILQNNDKNCVIPSSLKSNFITVQNDEGSPNTIAEIIIENDLDFIPKISVIIPVNNMEEYLSQCLDSVINQTLKEIEIICVDDGSEDNSLNILKIYAKRDKRIMIVKQENLHSGVARNAGLSVAKGEYLCFLDSDDYFELNMLEEMYKKITKMNSDIVICKSKSIDLDSGKLNLQKFNKSLRIDLIPKTNKFSVKDIPKHIFQFCEGWAWDKLFRTDFILSNNIKFSNILIFNDNLFTYTAICYASSITTIEERFVIKRHGHKKSLSSNRWKDPACFLISFEKIEYNLKKKGLYDLVKESYWEWVFKLCLIQLKNLDNFSKKFLFKILHKKFKLWNFIDNSSPSSNRYRALHYIKYQKDFPTINIAYIVNEKNFNLCLISIVSILKNSEYENINIIILYNEINQVEFMKIYQLKEIRHFTLQIMNISDEQFMELYLKNFTSKDIYYSYILAEKFPVINKILYIDCNTIVKKSLLSLWEINMNSKLIGAVEDYTLRKEKEKNSNFKDNSDINTGVLLINTKEWRNLKLFNRKKNQVFKDLCSTLNKITDNRKIFLNPEYNYIKFFSSDNYSKYNSDYLKFYNNTFPTIIHSNINSSTTYLNNTYYINEYLIYNNILKKIKNSHINIPIVLSSDDNCAPLMYTAMLSILENQYKTTYYIFFLLVPFNFSKNFENEILALSNKYKCYIQFIYINKKEFRDVIMHIPHINYITFYRLLIADLLPKEIDKCIYLDVDICALKDLSQLFTIDLKDNYLAGVISPGYVFNEKKNCKRLNISSMKQYINAGMLVMNLKQLRKDNMTKKFLSLSKKNYQSQDQDVINVACYGKIITLPPKYNLQVTKIHENNPLLSKVYKNKDIIEAKSSPYIIHYSNKNKPWNSLGVYMEKYWWDIAKKTPYINNLFNKDDIYKESLQQFWKMEKNISINLERPNTFNEKIQWLKLYESIPIKNKLSDKLFVREWAKEKIGEEFLIPLFGVYDKFKDIKFKKLPDRFKIICNHGNGYIILVNNKTQLNLSETKEKVNKWMNEDYAFKPSLELEYRNIPHKILIEDYVHNDRDDIKDYEFLCFYGKPKFLLLNDSLYSIDSNNYIDLKDNILTKRKYYNKKSNSSNSEYLEKMVKLACLLSNNLTYVKVHFSIINNKIYFRELKFTSSIETKNMIPKNLDRKLSSLIKLPKMAFNIDIGEYYYLDEPFSLYPFFIILVTLTFKLLYNLWNLMKLFL